MAINQHKLQEQIGFDDLLAGADRDNERRHFENKTAHLPGAMDEALLFYRALLDEHHVAMIAADADEAMRLRNDAHLLARKFNGGEPGILAHDDAPGYVLGRETKAPDGQEPLWGQEATFVVAVGEMAILIEMDGIFGICGNYCYWPGFSANVIDESKPFLSKTGYRSFLGIYSAPVAGMTPERFAREICEEYIETALKGG